MSPDDEAPEPFAEAFVAGGTVVLLLVSAEHKCEIVAHILQVVALAIRHIEVEDGVPWPVLFEFLDSEPREKLLFALEVILERGAKQRLAKASWAAEEDGVAKAVGEVVDVLRFVDVDKPVLSYSLKVLHSGRETSELFHVVTRSLLQTQAVAYSKQGSEVGVATVGFCGVTVVEATMIEGELQVELKPLDSRHIIRRLEMGYRCRLYVSRNFWVLSEVLSSCPNSIMIRCC